KDPRGGADSAELTYATLSRLLGGADVPGESYGFMGRSLEHLHHLGSQARQDPPEKDFRGDQLEAIRAVLLRRGWSPGHGTGTMLPISRDGAVWTLRIGSGRRCTINARLSTKLPPTEERTPVRTIDLARGWSTFSIPTPFPGHERPWIRGDVDRMHEQAVVVGNLLEQAYDLWRAAHVDVR
ncbi:MAG: hypothetical protein H6736_24135, partial [Alphaproteobacteria bacterium]|nr:hypothetical protein [Alphaproteobacteria bacterium]